ncbi:MAG: hypothetical protein NZM07_03450 [Elioraea sp.]|nr:hypothetical protein [Elioraea sp.]
MTVLRRVVATQFDRPASTGRTRPLFLTCRDAAGEEVEVIAKLSARCDQGVVNLAREVIAACLAADLGLPVPEPVLVELPPDWIASVTEAETREALGASVPVAFGSKQVGPQFSAWKPETRLTPAMRPLALAIFVFDALTANPDRRAENPNCLVRGEELRIYDHEMAFTHHMVIPRLEPWRPGALQDLTSPGRHIFRDRLRGAVLDFCPVRAAWAALSDAGVEGYAKGLPAEWAGAAGEVNQAIRMIKDIRDRMEGCLKEVARVLA